MRDTLVICRVCINLLLLCTDMRKSTEHTEEAVKGDAGDQKWVRYDLFCDHSCSFSPHHYSICLLCDSRLVLLSLELKSVKLQKSSEIWTEMPWLMETVANQV